MSAAAYEKIAAGLEAALEIAKGTADPASYVLHIPSAIDVKAIRKKLKLSQEAFATRYGFSRGRIRDWEQNRSSPDMSSRLLLKVIEREPEAIERAVAAG